MGVLPPIQAPTASSLARDKAPRAVATDPAQRLSSFEDLRKLAQEEQESRARAPGKSAPPKAGKSGVMSERDEAKLKKSLGEFEAIFLQQMLSSMRKNVPESGGPMGESGQGEKIFRDLLDTEYARLMSQTEHKQGLKESMFDQLTRRLKQGRGAPGMGGEKRTIPRESLKSGVQTTMNSTGDNTPDPPSGE